MSEEGTITEEALTPISEMNNKIDCTATPDLPFCILTVSDKNFVKIHFAIYEKQDQRNHFIKLELR